MVYHVQAWNGWWASIRSEAGYDVQIIRTRAAMLADAWSRVSGGRCFRVVDENGAEHGRFTGER